MDIRKKTSRGTSTPEQRYFFLSYQEYQTNRSDLPHKLQVVRPE